jgi:hypothetical protein
MIKAFLAKTAMTNVATIAARAIGTIWARREDIRRRRGKSILRRCRACDASRASPGTQHHSSLKEHYCSERNGLILQTPHHDPDLLPSTSHPLKMPPNINLNVILPISFSVLQVDVTQEVSPQECCMILSSSSSYPRVQPLVASCISLGDLYENKPRSSSSCNIINYPLCPS